MFCKFCGHEIADNAIICVHCGRATDQYATVNKATQTTAPVANKQNTIAIVGFVLSFIIALAGLICSIIGYRKAKNEGLDGGSLALAGIIISAVSMGLSIILSFIWIPAFISLFSLFFWWAF